MTDYKKNPSVLLDVDEMPTPGHGIFLSIQHLFAMFGSTVLVPILVGLDPGIALFASGVGTLLHILITHRKIPLYMGSSFAFITIMISLMKTAGYPAVAQGIIAVGVVYLVVALIVNFVGHDWIDKALPPIVVGPIVMDIGLSLAGTAAKDATMTAAGAYSLKFFAVAIFTMMAVIVFTMFFKGFISQVAILLGIIAGYLLAAVLGLVDFTPIANAPWFKLPNFDVMFLNYKPKMYWGAIIGMMPIAFVTMTEHLGHIMVLNDMTGRNFFKEPGLAKTLAGDGTASIFAGLVGGPALTSYGENIGVMAITKIHSVYVIIGAAVFAVIFSFIGKLSALIQSIPRPVLGGVSFLLFGVIAASGLKILIENKVNLEKKRNLMIASAILVIGIGDAALQLSPSLTFSGLTVASIVGIILNFILPQNAASESEENE